MFAVVVGVITAVLSILVKIVGFPDQIRNNLRRKSTEGLSLPFYGLAFLGYSFWTLHGVLQNDWVLIAGQGIGIITTGIILYQMYLYRRT